MSKYLVALGGVWVALALIIGMVLMFSSIKGTMKQLKRAGGETATIVKEVHYFTLVPATAVKKNTANAVARVLIKGTYGEEVNARVKIGG